MRINIVHLFAVLAFTGLHAQSTVIFTEEFETGGVQSMSPQWIWDGFAPTFSTGCSGNWSVRKETPSGNDVNDLSEVEHWLFHPLPYDQLKRYKLSVDFRVEDPDMGGPDNFDEPFAFGGIGWMDMNPGAVNMALYSVYSSVGPCDPTDGGFNYAYGGSPGAGWQFGVVLGSISPPGTLSPMWVEFDHLVVTTTPGNAQFVGSVLLSGPYDPVTQTMSDALRQQGLVPLTEPYTALGWPQVSGGGGETTTPAVLNALYPGGHVVDWIRLELRALSNNTQIVATRQALVLQDGTIISASGSAGVLFDILPGSYWIAVRHRNHLGAMTFASYQVVYPGGGIWTYPFSIAGFPSYGTNGREVIGNKALLWEGNAVPDGLIKYMGASNDRDPILVAVGGVPTSIINGQYRAEDVNLDGTVKYTGANNDRDPILVTVGGTVPTATRTEQLP